MMANATAKINAAPAAAAAGTPAAPAQPFDIAKFAGIFAAFGMALGAIGTALTSIFSGIMDMAWWKTLLVLVAILLLISGPAMVMAWMKLRRRNIAPLLNANGWAVNAASKISIPFGETLTDVAKYPKLKLKDPYAKKGNPAKAWIITILALVVVACGLWLANVLSSVGLQSPLPRFNQPETAVEEVIEPAAEEVTESVEEAVAVEETVAE